jgi:hypothetical protein
LQLICHYNGNFIFKVIFRLFFGDDRFVQNLVFYGVSQNTGKRIDEENFKNRIIRLGAWLSNPYIAFAAGALVEIVAYCVVHLVLDRWGRKLTFCIFVILFGIVSFLVVPVQMFMIKNSRSMI